MVERRLLILGGTGEARELARRLEGVARLRVISSLAGRTQTPLRPAGTVRIGGFGGAEGLARFLAAEGIGMVVDATHPFAATISANAAAACTEAGMPRLLLLRPEWTPVAGDDWRVVADLGEAAAAIEGFGPSVFLATGRQGLEHFAGLRAQRFVVRLVDPPSAPLPLADYVVVTGRGPFTEAAEIELLRRHGVAVVVAKNSGGAATYTKLAAARRQGLPVVMVARPAPPPGAAVASVEAAVEWVERHSHGPHPEPDEG